MTSPDPHTRRIGAVDVFGWNPVRVDGNTGDARLANNFGDLLGPLLVARMVGSSVSRTEDASVPEGPTLLSVGSVLHFAPRGSVVWGSGVNFKVSAAIPEFVDTLDIRAVRGPLTARALRSHGGRVPEVYGDPGLLLPRYLPELSNWSRLGRGDALFVPNLNDAATQLPLARAAGIRAVAPDAPLDHVLQMIAESGFVVASSLHAVVVAESLGIPARFVLSQTEHRFKYHDYLLGTGRQGVTLATDIAEALSLGGQPVVEADLEPLDAAFPHDLWAPGVLHPEPSWLPEAPIVDEAWRAMMAAGPTDSSSTVNELAARLIPELTITAQKLTREPDINEATSDYVSYSDAFAAVRDYREQLVPDLGAEQHASDTDEIVHILDANDPRALLRHVWMADVGPHSYLRKYRSTGETFSLALSIRPGSIAREMTSITVELVIDDEVVASAFPPVFDQYREQWAIEVAVGLSLREAVVGTASVRVRVRGKTESEVIMDVLESATPARLLNSYGAVDTSHVLRLDISKRVAADRLPGVVG